MWLHGVKAYKIYRCLQTKKMKHMQKLTRCMHLNTLKKMLLFNTVKSKLKKKQVCNIKQLFACCTNTRAEITIAGE
jgi:hypothetical protein